jgi:hypothetical protein
MFKEHKKMHSIFMMIQFFFYALFHELNLVVGGHFFGLIFLRGGTGIVRH